MGLQLNKILISSQKIFKNILNCWFLTFLIIEMLDYDWGNANYLFKFTSAENMKREKQNCLFLSFYDQLFKMELSST